MCGLGGGNFSASMAHIRFLFPHRMQGVTLGLNAGIGNLGVGLMQAIVPLIIYGGALAVLGGNAQTNVQDGVERAIWLQNAGFIWVPFIIVAAVAAWFGMDNIRGARAKFQDEIAIFRRKHAWLLAWLYIGTFGSFIGFSAGFPMLLDSQFPGSDAIKYAFIGPLLGAFARPLGGWLADHCGGARVSFLTFIVIAVTMCAALVTLPSTTSEGHLAWFFAMFLLLFLAAGIGNGSVFRMVPSVFLRWHRRNADGQDAMAQANSDAQTESAVALGFTASLAALGAFYIPLALGISINLTGQPFAALMAFVVFYLSCVMTTWWWYFREGAEVRC